MAASQGPRRKTASGCSPEMEQCAHTVEIAGYSFYKGLAAGKYIWSASFTVGGHDWCLLYFPNGDTTTEESKNHVSVYLMLDSKATDDVKVLFDFRLVNQTTGLSKSETKGLRVFKSMILTWGTSKFKKRSELEAMPYLKDDRVAIECDLTIVTGTPVSGSTTVGEIQVTPSDLSDDLGKLLVAEDGTDVTCKVEGEVFHAHKIVLAMRSPVFKAELYGPMSDVSKRIVITVDDMQPVIFRALLRFIYTDSLPAMDDLDGDEHDEMAKHLLVAADRYAMEPMKLLCESILCKRLDIESVGSTLALADHHHCAKLKDVCIEFTNSLNRKSDVEGFVASQWYGHLKRACH